MTGAVEWTELPRPPCAAFARSRLGWDEALSLCLRGLPFEEGAFFSFVPPDVHIVSSNDLGSWTEGLQKAAKEIRSQTACHLLAHLNQSPDSAILLNSECQFADPRVSRLETPWLALGPGPRDYICHYLRSGASLDQIEGALLEARAFYGIAVLTRDPDNILERADRSLSADHITTLVKQAEWVMFEAFDDLGNFFWRPSTSRDNIGP